MTRLVTAVGLVVGLLGILLLCTQQDTTKAPPPTGPYAQWENSLSGDPDFFPISVWMQPAEKAAEYKTMGINLIVAQWNGPTEKQLTALKAAGMKVICEQNPWALANLDDYGDVIVGWMHGDEPDNAVNVDGKWAEEITRKPRIFRAPEGVEYKKGIDYALKGEDYGNYGTPIHPTTVITDYHRIKAADPTRPVYLNLAMTVAYFKSSNRGIRSGHMEDYLEYVKGGDIISYDIYPVTSKPPVAGNLWYVPKGVDSLRSWTKNKKPVWCWIECTHVGNPDAMPTVAQVKSEVWMALIHGAKGYGYFCHDFTIKDSTMEFAPLVNPEMKAGMTAINKEVLSLARPLNSPTIKDGAAVVSDNKEVPVDVMVKKEGGTIYIFAVAMRDGKTGAAITVKGAGDGLVTVIGEKRSLDMKAF